MKLVYFDVPQGNFGDDLNLWLWDALLPGWRDWRDDAVLVGVGTILKKEHLPQDRLKLVVGSGTGYGSLPDLSADPAGWDVRAVRGPRTAALLGLPPEKAFVDPAVLLADLPEFQGLERGEATLFVPHHGSIDRFDWPAILAGTGIEMLDPRGEAHEVVRRLATARRVIAESMHAAIIADAFRVPWTCVAVSNAFNTFKWGDWAASLDIDLKTTRFFPLLRRLQAMRARNRPVTTGGGSTSASGGGDGARRLRPVLTWSARRTMRRVARAPFQLSGEGILAARKTAFHQVLAKVRADYGR